MSGLAYTFHITPATAVKMLADAGVPGPVTFQYATDLDSMQRIARARLDGHAAVIAQEKLHDAVTMMLAGLLAPCRETMSRTSAA